jgi:2,5-furandicarboxylate decarboxylase 1
MRGFLAMVERDFPNELVHIHEPVRRELDITATVFELERAGRSPVIVFDRVEGFDMPVVTNIAGNRRLLAAVMGVDPGMLATTFRERCQNYRPVERVDRAPWQELVIEGDDLDLRRLPIPIHFAVDAAPYITAGQICARDPETGVDTTGFHRLMLNGRNRLGVSLHSRRRMYEFHRRAEARGEPLPAVITLGVHPIHYMGSMAFHYPPGIRKYEIIGALFWRALPRRGLRPGGTRCPGRCGNRHRRDNPQRCARTGRTIQRVHRLRVLPQHRKCLCRRAPSYAA